MDNVSITLHIASLVLLVVLSAFFSGSETALMVLNKLRLKHQIKEGKKGAKLLDRILKHPDSLLGTILLGNNLVNVASSAIATSLAIYLWGDEMGIIYATIIMTLILLVFAEVTPKTYSAYHSEGVSYLIARPMMLLMAFLKPLVVSVTFFTNGLLKLFGIRKKKGGDVLTEDELKTMILMGEEAGILERKKKRMLHGILDLMEISVKDVMTPRTEVFAVDARAPLAEIKKKIMSAPYSRIPIYRGDIEKMEGVLLVRDFLKALASGRDFKIEDIITPPYFIPEGKTIQNQLSDFQRKQSHMAVVLDEFGGIEGIVTMEDLLEEIVGEIWDESDMMLKPVTRYDDGSLSVDGRLTIRELGKELDIEMPEEDFSTVAGLVMHSMGRIPEKGEFFEYHGFLLTVQKVVGQAIKKVRISRIRPE